MTGPAHKMQGYHHSYGKEDGPDESVVGHAGLNSTGLLKDTKRIPLAITVMVAGVQHESFEALAHADTRAMQLKWL